MTQDSQGNGHRRWRGRRRRAGSNRSTAANQAATPPPTRPQAPAPRPVEGAPTPQRAGNRSRRRTRTERAAPAPTFAVGQRVKFIDPLKPTGGRVIPGTIIRAGDFVDIRWDDGRTSLMVATAALELWPEEKDEASSDEADHEAFGAPDD